VLEGGTLITGTAGMTTFTVNATDTVGNATSQSVSYSVRYGTKLLYSPPVNGNVGSTVPIKLEPIDASGKNRSSASLTVQALCVVVKGATDCSGSPPISFGSGTLFSLVPELAPGGGYQFNVKTIGLKSGTTYQLLFRVAGEDASSYHVDAGANFTLTK
jgi:hypothetical protein